MLFVGTSGTLIVLFAVAVVVLVIGAIAELLVYALIGVLALAVSGGVALIVAEKHFPRTRLGRFSAAATAAAAPQGTTPATRTGPITCRRCGIGASSTPLTYSAQHAAHECGDRSRCDARVRPR